MATSTKYIAISYNAGTDTSSQLVRTFNDNISVAANVAVSYNGQRIPMRVAETILTTNAFAKYFYEVSGISGSGFTITIKANQHFRDPGLNVSEPETAYTISATDLFYVEYTYTI